MTTDGANSAADGYPLPAFYFSVSINQGNRDSAFSEVSGIEVEVSTEEVVEGGENRFIHQLPKGVKHANLELKRGIAPLESPLVKWCKKIFEDDFDAVMVPRNLTVSLLDQSGVEVRGWQFVGAYPVKWAVEAFNSTKNEVAIEKIVLCYQYVTRTK